MDNFNKLVILGTGARDENGNVCITDIGRQRIHKAIEAAAMRDLSLKSNEPFILITGRYSPALFDERPANSEAEEMRNIALKIYGRDGLTADAFILEDESTSTEENIDKSFLKYPEFFQETIAGERKLAFVSHEAHVGKAALYAAEKLPCSIDAIAQIAIRERNASIPDLSVYRGESEPLPLAGDE